MKIITKLALGGAVAIPGLILSTALGLVFSAEPTFSRPAVAKTVVKVEENERGRARTFHAGDGARLNASIHPGKPDDFIVLVHGILSNHAELERTSEMLVRSTGATVVNLDLRGHGKSEGRFGDVKEIGQYEGDLADVVAEIRRESPKAKVVLAGHSMGGGIVLRYAERKSFPPVDGYLLFAPALGYEAPTTRKDAGPADSEPFLKIHLKRIIGLSLLNAAGITAFNDLDTLYFNVSTNGKRMNYSFRAMNSMSPTNLQNALDADEVPLLTLVGSRDEAFIAEAFPGVIARHRYGKAVIIEGETHDGILANSKALDEAGRWHRER
jgi:alpha-beta hydrolase superfamily lysophospholipase